MGGGGGGSGGLTHEQKVYQEEKWKFDWQQLQNRNAYSRSVFDTKVLNDELIREHKNEIAEREWLQKEEMRIFDFNQQIEAYNASVKSYEQQLDYNALAQHIAQQDNTRKYNERLTDIGFKNEERIMNLGLEQVAATHQMQKTKAGLTAKAQETRLQGLQAEGKVLASGQTGRSARKNLQSVLAQQGAMQSLLVDQLTKEETGYQFAIDTASRKAALGGRQLQESVKSAAAQMDADNMQINLQKRSADMQAEAAIMPKPVKPPQLRKPLHLPKPGVVEPPPTVTSDQWEKLKPPTNVGGGKTSGGFMGMVMAGLNIAGAFASSDDRLKYDITRVGTSPNGIPKYTFRYRMDGKHGPKYIGTSAQDLISIGREDAVGQKEKDGFYYVDYSKLDVDMEVVTT